MNLSATFAYMAADVYNDSGSDIGAYKWLGSDADISIAGGAFYGRAWSMPGKMRALAFRGSDPFTKIGRTVLTWGAQDIVAIGYGALTAMAPFSSDAFNWTRKNIADSADCWLVGHSLGGAWAQILSSQFANCPGMTFNAPGVLNLVDEMSANPFWKAAGSLFSPARLPFAGMLLQAVSVDNSAAFAPVKNFRADGDLVSLIGTHVGSPLQTVTVGGPGDPYHRHLMPPLIAAFDPAGARLMDVNSSGSPLKTAFA